MKYVLAHTPRANGWLHHYPRLYAYPKTPDTSGDDIVFLDSGAFGLSLVGRSIDDAHMAKLSQHYEAHAHRANVVPIAPDVFGNPTQSLKNFDVWHERYAIPVAPVLQLWRKSIDGYSILHQLRHYMNKPLPDYFGKPVIMFSNPGWRGIEFRKHAPALRKAMSIARAEGVWLHNLGAGWDVQDITIWRDYNLFASIDSIAWYTDADAGMAWGAGEDIYRANADAGQRATSNKNNL